MQIPLLILSLFRRLPIERKAPTLDRESDEALMLRFQSGDEVAFSHLLERLERPLFFYIYRIVKDREQAEDVLQDTFMRMVQHASSYRPEAPLRAWVYKIAKNRSLDMLRRKDRRYQSLDAPLTHEGAFSLLDLIVDEESAEGSAARDQSEIRERIMRAVDALPELQREVFLLREVDGLKFREIAALKEVSENTIKSRMRYALESLRYHLDDYASAYLPARREEVGDAR
ncbi:MAG: sigma-70 family RNA polymerase sigma factor [Myxococcota bacterium]|nr:sigma-70 family RNA polymerase sigma factor [Myxococcota bacterium]